MTVLMMVLVVIAKDDQNSRTESTREESRRDDQMPGVLYGAERTTEGSVGRLILKPQFCGL